MSGNRDRKDYQRRYYEEKLKAKRQRKPMGLAAHTNSGQLELFTWNQEEDCQPTPMVDTQKVVEKSTMGLKSQPPLSSSTMSSAQPQLRLVEFNHVSTSQPTINQCQPSTMVDFSTTSSASTIDAIAESLQQAAVRRLFPNAKRKINFLVIGQILLLATLSVIIVTFTAQSVVSIDKGLLPLVLLLELVAMFFSLTLAQWSGTAFLGRSIMIVICVGLANFLIAKATFASSQERIHQDKGRAEQVQLMRSEILREQTLISDLQARGRITAAREEGRRLDALIEKMERLSQKGYGAMDAMMTWLMIVIRVVLGLSVVFINHQISKLIVAKRFSTLSV